MINLLQFHLIYHQTTTGVNNSYNRLTLLFDRNLMKMLRPREPDMSSRKPSAIKQPSPDTDATTHRPERRHDQAAPTSPYSNKPIDDAALSHEIEIDITDKNTQLPPGWHFEDGYIAMNGVCDEWQIKGNYLIRKHYVPRCIPSDCSETTCHALGASWKDPIQV